MAGVGNPYGAVPEAMKELRLSLSDALSNIVATKELDRRAAWEAAQAEVEKEKIQAGIEQYRQEQTTRRTGMEIESLWKGKQFGLEEERLGLEKGKFGLEERKVAETEATGAHERGEAFKEKQRTNTALINMWKAQSDASRANAQKAAEDMKRDKMLNTEMSMREWGAKFGLSENSIRYFGVSPDAKAPGWAFLTIWDKATAVAGKDPRVPARVAASKMTGELVPLLTEYKKNPTPALYSRIKGMEEEIGNTIAVGDMAAAAHAEDNEKLLRAEYARLLDMKSINPNAEVPIEVPIAGKPGKTRLLTSDEYVKLSADKKRSELMQDVAAIQSIVKGLKLPGEYYGYPTGSTGSRYTVEPMSPSPGGRQIYRGVIKRGVGGEW